MCSRILCWPEKVCVWEREREREREFCDGSCMAFTFLVTVLSGDDTEGSVMLKECACANLSTFLVGLFV